METFLHSVAADLYGRVGNTLSDCIVLMPNNRSRIFFVDALSEVAGHTLWAPHYSSIDELMEEIAGVRRVDPIVASVELYKVYSEFHAESFDSFYHWGEILINDFDAIDKYLIDADRLFANIVDLKEFDADLSYMTPEQISLVKNFWSSFEGRRSDEKEKFLATWRTLAPIYHRFRNRLTAKGVATVGQMQRAAAEKIADGYSPECRFHYVAVGFNALSETERRLFDYLKTNHQTDFYWDYDKYYLDDLNQEAGLFVRRNVARYPMPPTFVPDSDFVAPKEINVVAAASDSLQTKYAADFLGEVAAASGTLDKRTAIVLTDESLLSPLLYSLPDNVGKVNITMGYPLKGSLVYSFVERLLLVQRRVRTSDKGTSFYHADVIGLLSHPYLTSSTDGSAIDTLRHELLTEGRIRIDEQRLKKISPLTDLVFTPIGDWHSLADYLIEVLSAVDRELSTTEQTIERRLEKEMFEMIAEQISKLTNSLVDCELSIDNSTYASLLRRMLQNLRIPYSGEPLRGVQIMGILETRNLDFDNVMLLSMSDDVFPSSRLADISFIPYNLRYAYGLPTPQHSEGVYAYYFYRLLQRARRVDLVYCSVADDKSSGEPSRYIYQLEYESSHRLRRRQMAMNVNLTDVKPVEVAKQGVVATRLEALLSPSDGQKISPSAFNDYIVCPLKFYFKRIAGFKVEDEISEEVDSSMFGTILHKAMYLLYKPLCGVDEPQSQIAALIGSPKVDKAVTDAIAIEYFNLDSISDDDLGGALSMVKESVLSYINRNILPFDAARRGYRIVDVERKVETRFDFDSRRSVLFGGISDRLDMKPDGTLRIIDYKTGNMKLDFDGIASLLPQLPAEHNNAALQTMLYSMMCDRAQKRGEMQGNGVCPSLYYVKSLDNPHYSPFLNDRTMGNVDSYGDRAEEFENALCERLCELFDYSKPFVQTDNRTSCAYCDFAKICRR